MLLVRISMIPDTSYEIYINNLLHNNNTMICYYFYCITIHLDIICFRRTVTICLQNINTCWKLYMFFQCWSNLLGGTAIHKYLSHDSNTCCPILWQLMYRKWILSTFWTLSLCISHGAFVIYYFVHWTEMCFLVFPVRHSTFYKDFVTN